MALYQIHEPSLVIKPPLARRRQQLSHERDALRSLVLEISGLVQIRYSSYCLESDPPLLEHATAQLRDHNKNCQQLLDAIDALDLDLLAQQPWLINPIKRQLYVSCITWCSTINELRAKASIDLRRTGRHGSRSESTIPAAVSASLNTAPPPEHSQPLPIPTDQLRYPDAIDPSGSVEEGGLHPSSSASASAPKALLSAPIRPLDHHAELPHQPSLLPLQQMPHALSQQSSSSNLLLQPNPLLQSGSFSHHPWGESSSHSTPAVVSLAHSNPTTPSPSSQSNITPLRDVESELSKFFDSSREPDAKPSDPTSKDTKDADRKPKDHERLPRLFAGLFDSSRRPSPAFYHLMGESAGLMLPESTNSVLPIAVLSQELSSIIAYVLTSQDYTNRFLQKFGHLPSERPRVTASKVHHSPEVSTLFSVASDHDRHIETRLDTEINSVRFRIKVISYFAQGFQSLRRLSCGDELQFLASMSRCQEWQARGGKSGSSWERTLDGRYIIKQISRTEAVSFLEFGPMYFRYMGDIFSEGIPSILAKCLGVYYVHYRVGSAKGSTLTVMVMENLFSGREISTVYDLKGSLRSRYVKSKNEALSTSEVWLDENLLEHMYLDPITVEEQSKAKLITSIYNDTLFLAHLDVMDYSLLVGIDETSNELAVGIIDYFRKYTWDKQIESWIKGSGVLGGRGQIPTVISPLQYMTRFREQIWLYFVLVPHKFTEIELQRHTECYHYGGE